jgi:hypothetical protein
MRPIASDRTRVLIAALAAISAVFIVGCGGQLPAAGQTATDGTSEPGTAATTSSETAPPNTDTEASGTISGEAPTPAEWFQIQDRHRFPYFKLDPTDDGWSTVDDVQKAEAMAKLTHLDVPELGDPTVVYSIAYPDGRTALLYRFASTPIGDAFILRAIPATSDPFISDTWCRAEYECQSFAVDDSTVAAYGRQSENVRSLSVEQSGVRLTTLFAAPSEAFNLDEAKRLAAELD